MNCNIYLPRYSSFVFILSLACWICPAWVHTGPGAETDSGQAWVETMLAARRAVTAMQSVSEAPLFQSAPMVLGQKAEEISVRVTGMRYLWLVIGDGGNGTGCDHSVWAEARLSDTKGRETPLADLPLVAAIAGWRHLQISTNASGGPLSIAGTRYKYGLWTHSRSFVCYDIGGRYETFAATIGIEDRACGAARVTFEVRGRVPEKDAIDACWKHIQTEFPTEAAWFAEDLADGRHLEWFRGEDDREMTDALVKNVCVALGGSGAPFEIRARQLADSADDGLDKKALLLYVDARKRLAGIQALRQTLTFCQETLNMVEQAAPRLRFHPPLKDLSERVALAADTPGSDLKAIDGDLRVLRRSIVLSHPLLDFETLLVNKRPPPGYNHQCDQYLGRHSRPGPGLVLLRNWKTDPTEIRLLEGLLPRGSVLHPDLSFDASRILFSYCDHSVESEPARRFCIYEIRVDGSGLRQLTGTPDDPMIGRDGCRTVLIEDFDPCYLPDGDIVFVSTRSQTFGRCHYRRYNPSYLLHRMGADGSNIRQLSFGEANEWDPSVLPDGRLIYTRWDYINRHDTLFQSLWTMRPDGTDTAHFYGNYSANPCMTAEARGIPGTRRVVCTATAHHAYTAGSLITIDPDRGQDGMEPLTRLTPDIPFPETEGWGLKSCAAEPWPLSEDLYLMAYNPYAYSRPTRQEKENAFGIYLLDRLGGIEEIYTDPEVSSFCPIPVVPRLQPPVVPSQLPDHPETMEGVFYVRDVHTSTQPIADQRITRLRINEIIGQPTASVPYRGKVRQEIIKRIVGTVPVNAAGRACFRAPAGVPLQLQALDENGMAVLTMRSFVYLQPGEMTGCVGCHESRESAPPDYGPDVFAEVASPAPPAGPHYPGGFSFMRSVQPVLDRYCIGCHGLQKTEGNLDLLGSRAVSAPDDYPKWPPKIITCVSYESLLARPGLVSIAQRNRETAFSRPKDYFAHAGRLAGHLLKGHCRELAADRESLQRVIDWLDLNAQFNGDYSFNRVEERLPDPKGEKALRTWIGRHFGKDLAAQPVAALVNVADPAQSRILLAPLAREAGGWGQITPGGWTDPDDPGRAELAALVARSIAPCANPDRAGTCGQSPCQCGCCWVEEAEKAWRTRGK